MSKSIKLSKTKKTTKNITLTKDDIEYMRSQDAPPSSKGKDYLKLLDDVCSYVRKKHIEKCKEEELINQYEYLYDEYYSLVSMLSDSKNKKENFNNVVKIIKQLYLAQMDNDNLDPVKKNFEIFLTSIEGKKSSD